MFAVQDTVSITDFRLNLADWFTKAKFRPILVFQNSRPKVAIVDPEYLEYLEKYANGFYDAGDAAEIQRAIDSGELKDTVPFNVNDYI